MGRRPRPDYPIGYGKPPEATRWPKGQSGNPRGRPKRSRNLAALIHRTLSGPFPAESAKGASTQEVLLRQAVNAAIGGDQRAAAFVIRQAKQCGLIYPQPAPDAPAPVILLPEPFKGTSEEWYELNRHRTLEMSPEERDRLYTGLIPGEAPETTPASKDKQ